ncbi:MAG: class I SAM-dependent methyltransferase [Gemmatimonadales bacterium]|jgi:SAM-dependent methyltransferase
MTELLVRATAGRELRSVLDVGCGAGGYTVQHAEALGVPLGRVTGVEYNPDNLTAARQRFRTERVDLERDELPLGDGSVDLIICNQVLEHMKNVFWALAEMDRVLAVGGVLAVGIPNLTSLLNRAVLLVGRQPVTIDIAGPHVRGFAHRSFRHFLLRHPGYVLKAQLGSSLYPWPTRLGAERLARRLPGLSAYTFYGLLKEKSVEPCPWLAYGTDGETSYTHAEKRALSRAEDAGS